MKHEVVNVDFHDTLVSAIQDAEARAASVFSSHEKTLVDSISQKDWDSWDASGERPNVADSEPLDSEEPFDDCMEPAAA